MFVRIANRPRDYAWGDRTLISEYLGTQASGGPEAEVWLGAHPSCPARTPDGTGLDAYLAAAGVPAPPFLFKVLAAAVPLSLQVHPSTEQARAGFARENAAGIKLDAPNRNYKDPYAKPELIVAVTPFEALSGFRPKEESLATLRQLAERDERVLPFADLVARDTRAALSLLLRGGASASSIVAGVVAAVSAGAGPARDADTVKRVSAAFPGDPGVAIALLLHRVSLAPGEALFLPAGNLHAYLAGLGLELMGPSDNVLRGGLTPKYIDVDELLATVDVTPIADPLLPSVVIDGGTLYRPAADFELIHVTGRHEFGEHSPGIVLSHSDDTVVELGDVQEVLELGAAAFVSELATVAVRSADAWVALVRDTP